MPEKYEKFTFPDGSKKDVGFEHLETVKSAESKPSKKEKLKRHFKRFWLCYLIAGIVFLAIFLPLL